MCACVLALVLGGMCHLVPAACKDASSSIRCMAFIIISSCTLQGFVTTLYIVCVLVYWPSCLDGWHIWCQQPVVIFYQVASYVLYKSAYSLVTSVVRVCTFALVLVLYNHVSLSSSVSKNNDKFGSYMYGT